MKAIDELLEIGKNKAQRDQLKAWIARWISHAATSKLFSMPHDTPKEHREAILSLAVKALGEKIGGPMALRSGHVRIVVKDELKDQKTKNIDYYDIGVNLFCVLPAPYIPKEATPPVEEARSV